MWRMVREKNAIEVLAVQFTFAEPLNNVLTRRVKDDVAPTARVAGYVDPVALQGFRVTVGNGNAPPEVVQLQGQAVSFQKSGLDRDFKGAVQNVLKGKIDVTPTELLFQTFEYENWSKVRDTIATVMTPGLRRAMQGTALGSIRFEYLDRFVFEGDKNHSSPAGLLNPSSKWVTPHIFGNSSLWHSHTGLFEDVQKDRRTLIGVNADLQEVAGDHEAPDFGKRTIQLVTFSEFQFSPTGGEVPSEEIENRIPIYLNELYLIARRVFSEVIDSDFAKRNGLPTCEG